MSDDSSTDDRRSARRPKKNAGSGNNVVMILLIVFGSLAGLAILGCCGVVGVGCFVGKKVLQDADLKNPADIQRVTAEITEITIPPEFVPKQASSIFVMKMVQYEWCPTGTCARRDDGFGTMTLTSIGVANDQASGSSDGPFPHDELSEDQLQRRGATIHEFTIRGRKCRFTIM